MNIADKSIFVLNRADYMVVIRTNNVMPSIHICTIDIDRYDSLRS